MLEEQANQSAGEIRIDIFADQGRPFSDPVLKCMNADMFADLLEVRVQEHLPLAVNNLGIRYIRITNTFDPELKIRSGHGSEQMNFGKIDAVPDFLLELEQQVIPVIEFPARLRRMIVSISSSQVLDRINTDPVFLSSQKWERVPESTKKWSFFERSRCGIPILSKIRYL